MGLADTIANAISTVKSATADLQPQVTLKQWIGQNRYGDPDYAEPVVYNVIANQETRIFKREDGQESVAHWYVAFLQPVTPAEANAPHVRVNPVDTRDVITLPDGTTGPIVSVSGFINGATGVPFFSEVWLG